MNENGDYYLDRAEAELALARAAAHPAAARAHYFLAGYYLDKAHGDTPPVVEYPGAGPDVLPHLHTPAAAPRMGRVAA
jgi:uncharacterized protein YfeS